MTRLIDPETQKELSKQTVEPRKALELAIHMELALQNQHQKQTQNTALVPLSNSEIQYPSSTCSSNWSTARKNIPNQGSRPSPIHCPICGVEWVTG